MILRSSRSHDNPRPCAPVVRGPAYENDGETITASPPAGNLPLPPLPDEKVGVISIYIPWHFRSRAPTQNHHISRSPQRHYPTMDLEHAEQLPIKHQIGRAHV